MPPVTLSAMVFHPDPKKRYIPLESNPEVFTELIQNLGIQGLKFQDVYSVDDPELLGLVERPVHSLVFIYPGDSKAELEKKSVAQGSEPYALSGDAENAIWFRQTIPGACGLYAIVHALANGSARKMIPSSSAFDQLLQQCIPLAPDGRAEVFEASAALEEAHRKAAMQGCTPAPSIDEPDPPAHYCAFVRGKDNHIYEMNGTLNGPLDKGVVVLDEEGGDMLCEKALGVVRKFIRLEEGKNVNFSLMALVNSTS